MQKFKKNIIKAIYALLFISVLTQDIYAQFSLGNKTYKLSNLVDSGSFGGTYRSVNIKNPYDVVIVKKPKNINDQSIYKEISTLKKLKGYPNIVDMLGFYKPSTTQGSQGPYIILEFLPNGDLNKFISKRSLRPIPETNIRKYAIQLIRALKTLKKEGVIHTDLHVKNVMFDKYNNIKVIDFGLAVQTKHNSNKILEQINFGGERNWIAPEVQNNNLSEYYSKFLKNKTANQKINTLFKIDIWSLGYLLFALAAQDRPTFIVNTNQDVKKQKNSLYKIENQYTQTLQDLISHLIVRNPEKRYDLSKIKNHKWIKGYGSPLSITYHELRHFNQERHQKYSMRKRRRTKINFFNIDEPQPKKAHKKNFICNDNIKAKRANQGRKKEKFTLNNITSYCIIF